MWRRAAAGSAAAMVALLAAVSHGQTPAATAATHSRAADFLDRLKQAVDSADRRAVSTMGAYPLTVLASGFNIPVKDAATFIRMYGSLMTPELRCAVMASEISTGNTSASRRTAVITPDGLSLVDGAVWAPFKEGRYRIARIRVLPPVPSVEGRNVIERVTFAEPKGERSASFTGWLVRHNVDVFVVGVRKGETVQARIDGFRGHDATLRLSPQSPATAGPATTLPDIGRTTSARAAADGEYRIEVAHLAPYCDPPQRYKLTVAVFR
jgi:hypothetical protein